MQIVIHKNRSYMIVQPAAFMLNSSLVSSVINRGDYLAVDLETYVLTAIPRIGKPKLELTYVLSAAGQEDARFTSATDMSKSARKLYDSGTRVFGVVIFNHDMPVGTAVCRSVFQDFRLQVNREIARIAALVESQTL